jgi:hypothetical protein
MQRLPLSAEAEACLLSATELARTRRHEHVAVEHALLALLDSETSLPARWSGVDMVTMADEARNWLSLVRKFDDDEPPAPSSLLNVTLSSASEFVRITGRSEITTADVLGSLIAVVGNAPQLSHLRVAGVRPAPRIRGRRLMHWLTLVATAGLFATSYTCLAFLGRSPSGDYLVENAVAFQVIGGIAVCLGCLLPFIKGGFAEWIFDGHPPAWFTFVAVIGVPMAIALALYYPGEQSLIGANFSTVGTIQESDGSWGRVATAFAAFAGVNAAALSFEPPNSSKGVLQKLAIALSATATAASVFLEKLGFGG